MALPLPDRDRATAALATALVQGAIGYALIMGLFVDFGRPAADEIKVFEIAERQPEPKVEIIPPPERNKRPEGEASPPNLRSKATEIVAPPPVIPVPSPVIAAEKANIGWQATSGAADIPGPGTGAGGFGDGFGGGGAGDGDGGGADETPPRWQKGRLSYPREYGEAGIAGTVGVRYLVGVDGRVSDCRVTRSSGHGELDALTCRSLEQRFRFAPSRDGRGRPVPAYLVENHTYVVEDDPETPTEWRRR